MKGILPFFVAVALLSLSLWEEVRAANRIYWVYGTASDAKVQRADTNGSNVEDLVPTLPASAGSYIVLDKAGGKIYWTQAGGSITIRRANIEIPTGKNAKTRMDIEDLITEVYSIGVALDVAARKIYFTRTGPGNGKVQRANLDGSSVEDLVTGIRNNHRGIALDLTDGRMYWVNGGTGKIHRANLEIHASETPYNRTDIEDLVTELGAYDPWSIALDLSAGKMYFTRGSFENPKKMIQRANLDGSNVEDVITGLAAPPLGLALDVAAGKIYWGAGDKIQRANLDGSDMENIVTAVGSEGGFTGIALEF